MLVYGLDPFIQKRTLGFVLVGVLAFRFKNQIASGLYPDDKIWPVFVHDAFINIEHFETEMIVLYRRVDVFIAIQLESFRRFPGAVENTEVDMRPLREFAGSSL